MEFRDKVANQLMNQGPQKSPNKPSSTLTTSNGCPVDSITASQTAGPKGTITLQDFNLIDHLASFDRERIPERVVYIFIIKYDHTFIISKTYNAKT